MLPQDIIPPEIKKRALTLPGPDYDVWALSDALELIEALGRKYPTSVILGGDLFVAGQNGPKPAYENWHYDPQHIEADAPLSRQKAVEAIHRFESLDSGSQLFVDFTIQHETDSSKGNK